jgi:hypothetical protein
MSRTLDVSEQNVAKGHLDRRAFVRGGVLASLAWLVARPTLKRAAAKTAPRIIALQVTKVPLEPSASEWAAASASDISMDPQNITTPRIQEAGVKSLRARALYDAERVGILVEWTDANKQEEIGTVASFRDAVAIQFPSQPDKPIPYFGMGGPGTPVTIYQWKSDWQLGPKKDVDEAYPNMMSDVYPFSGVPAGKIPETSDYKEKGDVTYVTAWKAGNPLADLELQAKTSVEKLTAEGFGTAATAKQQDGQGKGEWANGAWRTVISLPRNQGGFTIADGQLLPLAFAAWDGSRQERNGRKAFSTWNELSIGGGGGLSPAVVGGIGAVAVAAVAGVAAAIWFRVRRRPAA